MRILHILTFHQPAGIENRVFRFIRTAGGHEHAVLVVSRRIHENFKANLPSSTAVRHWKYWGRFKIPAFLRKFFLKNWLKKNRFDLFMSYSQLSYPGLWDTLFENVNAPGVYWEEGAAWSKSKELKELIGRFDAYAAVSEASAVMLQKKFGVPGDKIKVIHNGIPEEKFSSLKEAAPAEKNRDRFIILYLGRLVPFKGVESLIRSLKFMEPDCELWIIGDGEEKGRLQELARETGVENRVQFKGMLVDPDPYLKGADLMVVPSIREPFGIVLLEAGAASLAVIASRVDGIPDIISHRKNGILIEPGIEIDRAHMKGLPELTVRVETRELIPPRILRPEDIAGAVNELKNNPSLRKRLGENLYNTVRKNFRMEDKILEFEKFSETLAPLRKTGDTEEG